MKPETWEAIYYLPNGNKRKLRVTADGQTIDDLRHRLVGVAKTWKKVG